MMEAICFQDTIRRITSVRGEGFTPELVRSMPQLGVEHFFVGLRYAALRLVRQNTD